MERRCEIDLPFLVRTYDIDYAGIVSNIDRLFPGISATSTAPHLPARTMKALQGGDRYGAATRRD
jgi:hypothetical protein